MTNDEHRRDSRAAVRYAAAEIRHSWKSEAGWAGIAGLALLYSVFTILGSGLSILGWGIVLFLLGLPIYFFGRVREIAT